MTVVIWGGLRLLDEGKSEPIDVVNGWIVDGSLFEQLTYRHGVDASLLDVDDRTAVLDLFARLADVANSARKFGVSQNGLALVIAYATEGLQQLAT